MTEAPADTKAVELQAVFRSGSLTFRHRKQSIHVSVKGIGRCRGGVVIDFSINRAGEPVPYNGPWVVINPPLYVDDPEGAVVLKGRRYDRDKKQFVETERRVRKDPLAALRSALRDEVLRVLA